MGGFAGGLLSGIQGVQSLAQQRRENQYRQDALALDRQRLEQQALAEQQRFQQQERSLAQQDRSLSQQDRSLDLRAQEYQLADRDFDFRLRSYEEGADQRAATLRGSELANTAQEQANRAAEVTARRTTNDSIIDGYLAINILDPNDPTKFNRDALRAGIESGSQGHIDLMLATATQSGALPKGSVAESIQPLPNGGYAVTVRNADDSLGAVTEDGSSRPDSRVVEFEPGRLAGLAETAYQLNVLSNQTKFDLPAFRAQMNIIEQDAKGLEREDAIAAGRRLEDLSYQRQLLSAIEDPSAQRAAFNALAAAETPQERADIADRIASDIGLPPRGAQPSSEPITSTAAPRLRARREQRMAQLEAEVTKAQEAVDRASSQPRMRASAQRRLAEATRKRDEFRQRSSFEDRGAPLTFAVPETAQEADSVAAKTEGMSSNEVARAIDSGDLAVTPALVSGTRQALEQAGVRTPEDLKRLNIKDRAIARAVMLASVKDPTIRASMSASIDNLFETGTVSMSRKDAESFRLSEADLGVRMQTLRQQVRKYGTDQDAALQTRIDTAANEAAEFQSAVQDLYFGPDGSENNLNAETARKFARDVLAPYNMKATKAASEEEQDRYSAGLNSALSLTVGALAAEEEGGFYETLASFFRFGDVADRTTTSDFDLSRVTMETRGGRPYMFYYTDDNGQRLQEGLLASDLQKLDSTIYNTVVRQVRRNEEKAKKKT